MTAREEAVSFECGGEQLVGVLSRGPTDLDTAVIIIVGGPQYRVGSHRQFVLLARRLSAAGHPVLRFDHRGIGDSGGSPRSFLELDADVAAAAAAVRDRVPAVRRIVLWGLCDGASAALLHVATVPDGSIAGLCLLNPWVRSEASFARTHVRHYYLNRLGQRGFWIKLLGGKLGLGAVGSFARNLGVVLSGRRASSADGPDAPFQQRMAKAWFGFDGPILLMLSTDDYTAKEFLDCCADDPAWSAALRRPRLERHDLRGADHTVSGAAARTQMEELTLAWLHAAVGVREPQASAVRQFVDAARS